MSKLKYIIAVYILFAGLLPAQSRTNLEVFYSLIDSSISLLPEMIEDGSGSVYTGNNALLYNYVVQKLKARYNGFEVSGKEFEISYALEKIKLEYGDIFRKRFLGDYFIERNFLVEGTAAGGRGGVNSFSIAYSDTAALDDLALLENDLHPFTKAPVPAEPFFAGITEPVVAIGAAAAAVVLFFIVRSK